MEFERESDDLDQKVVWGVTATQGGRKAMEDYYFVLEKELEEIELNVLRNESRNQITKGNEGSVETVNPQKIQDENGNAKIPKSQNEKKCIEFFNKNQSENMGYFLMDILLIIVLNIVTHIFLPSSSPN